MPILGVFSQKKRKQPQDGQQAKLADQLFSTAGPEPIHLGGLVVEQALLIARGSSEPHVKPLLHNTVAIAFMGTPHLGSRKADWAHSITRLSNLLRKTNKEIVAVLQPGSETLANLQQEFHTMLEDRKKNERKRIEIFCFYEELPYRGIGQIVPRESSILPGYPNISIHSNHSDMTKFSGELDSGYIRLRDQLWLWIQAFNKTKGVSAVSEQSQVQARDTPQDRSAVSSNGGAIFMGSVSAGRYFTYNSN
ncbi:hypothetical protein COCMIDRAFT_27072 [Bipolaris oryzae ATCC 44560]|uniref:Uncharacterized protein n=1 Tax=Bipolaris oryzae ATCC 44560 TaxID=930090 RepID=W6Z4G4_COCMI|nr:uncharacterized protein COCMIDRAFT_27072 [Bipolaris oryzae ATCC 44560]EUC44643.1 hypothetical protein COCMIDRAFT_27072 [Bipolaris oryzae ATCC 44560]